MFQKSNIQPKLLQIRSIQYIYSNLSLIYVDKNDPAVYFIRLCVLKRGVPQLQYL